jgi:menaquinol-cytochrome c reductase iron-sulfur subunit
MTQPNDGDAGVSRRGLLMKLGILLNGAAGLVLAVPIVGYLLSPMLRQKSAANDPWLSLGPLAQFPEGETRLATFRHPNVNPSDGETANIPCWVRHVAGEKFQVFAINCAHLGCPVRWFPQSGLFMCPCHGGVYYSDGARASGPPERGLFEYAYKVDQGSLTIQVGDLPTPGATAASLINIETRKTSPCA